MADNVEELQGKLAEEGTDEEPEDYGGNEPVDLSFLEEKKTPISSVIAAKATAVGERTGGAARRLLGGIGERIAEPAPPDDDLSDLFEGPNMETDNDVYIKDVVSVSEEDVFGEGGEEGLDEVLEVTEEDVMGDEDVEGYEPKAPAVKRAARRYPSTTPPGGIAGIQ